MAGHLLRRCGQDMLLNHPAGPQSEQLSPVLESIFSDESFLLVSKLNYMQMDYLVCQNSMAVSMSRANRRRLHGSCDRTGSWSYLMYACT